MYPDDLIILGEEISKRLIDKLLMDLRVATNPHLEPREAEKFYKELMDRRRILWGPMEHGGTLDKQALDMLKAQLQNTSQAIKVK